MCLKLTLQRSDYVIYFEITSGPKGLLINFNFMNKIEKKI